MAILLRFEKFMLLIEKKNYCFCIYC